MDDRRIFYADIGGMFAEPTSIKHKNNSHFCDS